MKVQIPEEKETNYNEPNKSNHPTCFLYDTNSKPTFIERIFGEPFTVKTKYPAHKITVPFILTLAAVYIVEGCLDWMMIAVRYYGTAIWDIGPSEMQQFKSIVGIPWTVKLIYGLIIDSISICGYKRKPYILIFGLLAPISIFITIIYAEDYSIHLAMMTIAQISIAFCDVIADALTVERTEFKSHSVATRLQSLAWGSRSLASIIGLLISARFQLSGKPKDFLKCYWLYFAISLLIPICSLFLPEKRNKNSSSALQSIPEDDIINEEFDDDHYHQPTYSIKEILCLTYKTLCRKAIFYPLLFTFLLSSTPSAGEAIDYYLIYELGFSSVQIGYLGVAAGIAFLISISILMYQSRENSNFSLRKMYLIWTIIAASVPYLTLILVFGINKDLGLPDFLFMMSDTIVIKIAQMMLGMGTNILFARICPPGIEGVFMTVLTSISNIGGLISYALSSVVISAFGVICEEDVDDENNVTCNFQYLWLLIVVVNVTTLIPLILIKTVPNEEQLQIIGEKLKNVTENHENEEKEEINKDDMISIYWLFMKVCCCNTNQNENEPKFQQDHENPPSSIEAIQYTNNTIKSSN